MVDRTMERQGKKNGYLKKKKKEKKGEKKK